MRLSTIVLHKATPEAKRNKTDIGTMRINMSDAEAKALKVEEVKLLKQVIAAIEVIPSEACEHSQDAVALLVGRLKLAFRLLDLT